MITTSYTLTDRQDAYITEEATRLQIGKSEFARRVWDEVIDGKGKPTQQIVMPPLLEPQEPDQSGSTTVRIWRSTQARLMELSTRTGLSNADVLDRLLRLPDQTLFALLMGNIENMPTIDPVAVEAIPLPPDSTVIDQFLAQHCIRGVGVSCSMDALYTSYEHFCGDNPAKPRRVFWDHLNERGFIVSMPTGTVSGIGLQFNAWAVLTGDAKGHELTQ